MTITNPEGLTAYGPTAKLKDKFARGFATPQFPTPTLRGLKLVFDNDEATEVWNTLGHRKLSRTSVRPLPSWWHLPSDAVTITLSLFLALLGHDPVSATQELVHTKIEIRMPENNPSDTLIDVFGFSANACV